MLEIIPFFFHDYYSVYILAKRLGAAKAEMDYGATEGNFDIIIVNDDLQNAYKALRNFILNDIRQLMPDRPVPLVLCGPSGV